MKRIAIASMLAALLAVSQGARAQEESVNIEAGEMEIIDADNKAVFRGDVVAKRTSETIRADQMVVTYKEVKQADGSMKNEVDTMVCTGGISIVSGNQTITGDKAVFHVLQDELLVTGNVKVVQGKTVLRGPQLVANLKTKRTVMKGGVGARVKGNFVP
jgi:lipopolysaccharide export system protein LptA